MSDESKNEELVETEATDAAEVDSKDNIKD